MEGGRCEKVKEAKRRKRTNMSLSVKFFCKSVTYLRSETLKKKLHSKNYLVRDVGCNHGSGTMLGLKFTLLLVLLFSLLTPYGIAQKKL